MMHCQKRNAALLKVEFFTINLFFGKLDIWNAVGIMIFNRAQCLK